MTRRIAAVLRPLNLRDCASPGSRLLALGIGTALLAGSAHAQDDAAGRDIAQANNPLASATAFNLLTRDGAASGEVAIRRGLAGKYHRGFDRVAKRDSPLVC